MFSFLQKSQSNLTLILLPTLGKFKQETRYCQKTSSGRTKQNLFEANSVDSP